MLVVLVKADLFIEFISDAVNLNSRISGLPEALEKLSELTLLTPYDRRLYDRSRAFRINLELVYYLVNAL